MLLVLIGSFLMSGVKAQPGALYAFTASNTTYTPITGGTVLISGTNWNNQRFTVNLPTSFWFNGQWHSTIHITANGYITLGSLMAANNFTPLASTATYAGAISPFGCNLQDANLATSEFRWAQVGPEIVVQWSNARRKFAGNTEVFSFQARLNTVNGVIRFVYAGVTNLNNSTAAQPQVGLRGSTNSYPMQVSIRSVGTGSDSWASPMSGTSNAATLRFTSSAPAKSPVAGQTYTFTPPAPCIPTVTIASSPAIIACPGASVIFTATPTYGGASPTYAWTINGTNVGTGPSYSTSTLVNGDVIAVTMTSSASCASPNTASANRTVSMPAPLSASATITSAILCAGGQATITVTPAGGTSPYTGTGTFQRPIGSHAFLVTDANGCTTTATTTVTGPAALSASASMITPIACHGGSATILVTASGGIGPYTGTGAHVSLAGPQVFPISDANGCTISAPLTINEPAALAASATLAGTGTGCGTSDASVLVTAAGGTGTLIGTGTITGQSAGAQLYTVTDANGCVATATIAIPEPDTDGDGTDDCVDQCPYDPAKTTPGTCGCDTPDDDTDGDGMADCVDPCPNSADNADSDGDGTLDCDDLCPNDPNKIYPGACGCGNIDADTDGDGYLDCLDGCPGDPMKIAAGNCGCGNPEPGMACDDGDANTTNDVVNGSCQCVGTMVLPCTNLLVLDLMTDGYGSQTSWTIEPAGGGAPLYQGGGYPSNAQLSIPNICLPNGSYILTVMDNAGNGIAAPGGYILRTADGRRIIDNTGNGTFTHHSKVADGFSLPLGALQAEGGTCDRLDLAPNEVLRVSPDPVVSAQFGVNDATSGYELWFFDPNGGYSRRVYVLHANASAQFPAGPERATYFRLNSLVTEPLPYGDLLNLRVRPIVANVAGAFGPACRLQLLQQTGNCITTQLDDTPGPRFSCGATGKRVKAPGAASRIHAKPAVRILNGVSQQADHYAFEFSEFGSGYHRVMYSTGSGLFLGQWYTDPLLCGTNLYDVRVKASFDGGLTWCPWGPTCTVEITNTLAPPFCSAPGTPMSQGSSRMATTQAGDDTAEEVRPVMNIWPNPNTGEELFVSITGIETDATDATIEVHDQLGRTVLSTRTSLIGSTVNTRIALNTSFTGGLYLVNVIIGDEVLTKRLVVH